MARATDQPLSVEEAKTCLRMTAEEALPIAYVRRHPYAVLSIALTAGFLFGRNKLPGNLFTVTMLKALWSINKSVWQKKCITEHDEQDLTLIYAVQGLY